MGKTESDMIAELLPFYLNGTLGPDEKEKVETALAAESDLRVQLAALRVVQSAVQSDDLGGGPGELGLARLRRDVGFQRQLPVRRRVLPLAAAFALGAVASALVIGLGRAPGDSYRQAGAPVSANVLVVGFRPEATVAQISDLLLSQDAIISDGPSAIGLYRVSLPEGADGAAVAGALRAADSVVETADKAE